MVDGLPRYAVVDMQLCCGRLVCKPVVCPPLIGCPLVAAMTPLPPCYFTSAELVISLLVAIVVLPDVHLFVRSKDMICVCACVCVLAPVRP